MEDVWERKGDRGCINKRLGRDKISERFASGIDSRLTAEEPSRIYDAAAASSSSSLSHRFFACRERCFTLFAFLTSPERRSSAARRRSCVLAGIIDRGFNRVCLETRSQILVFRSFFNNRQ